MAEILDGQGKFRSGELFITHNMSSTYPVVKNVCSSVYVSCFLLWRGVGWRGLTHSHLNCRLDLW